jgi:hypothetical protein
VTLTYRFVGRGFSRDISLELQTALAAEVPYGVPMEASLDWGDAYIDSSPPLRVYCLPFRALVATLIFRGSAAFSGDTKLLESKWL